MSNKKSKIDSKTIGLIIYLLVLIISAIFILPKGTAGIIIFFIIAIGHLIILVFNRISKVTSICKECTRRFTNNLKFPKYRGKT